MHGDSRKNFTMLLRLRQSSRIKQKVFLSDNHKETVSHINRNTSVESRHFVCSYPSKAMFRSSSVGLHSGNPEINPMPFLYIFSVSLI